MKLLIITLFVGAVIALGSIAPTFGSAQLEAETRGFKIDPRIIISIPTSLIVVSWALEIFLIP